MFTVETDKTCTCFKVVKEYAVILEVYKLEHCQAEAIVVINSSKSYNCQLGCKSVVCLEAQVSCYHVL